MRRPRSASRRSTSSRPASWRASRRSRRGWDARRASRCASTPTSTRRAIRTSRRASRSTSSACRSTTRASCSPVRRRPSLKLVAVHVHVGSQITSLDPLRRAAAALAARISRELQQAGAGLEYVDLGGGLGVSYDGGEVPSLHDYVSALVEEVRPTGLPIVLEPGRAIAAPAGALLARVIDVKPRTADSDFAIIDAGMTELLRPALYSAFHRIEPVTPRDAPASGTTKSSARSAKAATSSAAIRMLPPLEVGDLVAIRDAGAYGSAMASNYNRRPLPAEVLVDDGAWRVIRRRQTVDDMLALETCVRRSTRRLELEPEREPCRTPDRVRRARSERQADAGRAAARPPEAGGPQSAARVVSRLRHVDRRGDRARAAGRARVRARRDAAALHREPLRAESRTCSAGSTAG